LFRLKTNIIRHQTLDNKRNTIAFLSYILISDTRYNIMKMGTEASSCTQENNNSPPYNSLSTSEWKYKISSAENAPTKLMTAQIESSVRKILLDCGCRNFFTENVICHSRSVFGRKFL